MAIFLLVWTSALALVAAFTAGVFILHPSRARARRAAGFLAAALGLLVVTAFWLRA